jgi:hypothetical protein
MSRNWGISSVTRPATIGGNPSPASHYGAGGTRADSNIISLARHLPPGLAERNLAVVRDSSFLHQRELNPVEKLDAVFDHREFAVWFFITAFGISIGVLLAVAAALLDWS